MSDLTLPRQRTEYRADTPVIAGTAQITLLADEFDDQRSPGATVVFDAIDPSQIAGIRCDAEPGADELLMPLAGSVAIEESEIHLKDLDSPAVMALGTAAMVRRLRQLPLMPADPLLWWAAEALALHDARQRGLVVIDQLRTSAAVGVAAGLAGQLRQPDQHPDLIAAAKVADTYLDPLCPQAFELANAVAELGDADATLKQQARHGVEAIERYLETASLAILASSAEASYSLVWGAFDQYPAAGSETVTSTSPGPAGFSDAITARLSTRLGRHLGIEVEHLGDDRIMHALLIADDGEVLDHCLLPPPLTPDAHSVRHGVFYDPPGSLAAVRVEVTDRLGRWMHRSRDRRTRRDYLRSVAMQHCSLAAQLRRIDPSADTRAGFDAAAVLYEEAGDDRRAAQCRMLAIEPSRPETLAFAAERLGPRVEPYAHREKS